MAYWRMQLHPSQPSLSFYHAVESISAGFIGLDFKEDVGDLTRVAQNELPTGQREYWPFAHEMAVGDKVLVISHHFPVALVTVAGEYNYIRRPVPQLGVWFRHFREVTNPRYFADRRTNAAEWDQLQMTNTISRLVDPESRSYKLIDSWD